MQCIQTDIPHNSELNTTSSGTVVGRFAPSPSGRMHLGNVYAALLAWLSVRSQHGSMVLRVEDLDPRTQSGPWSELMLDDLTWLGLTWDEGPFYQHERTELYAEALEKLKEAELLYPCFCSRAELHAASAPHASDGTPIYPGTCRNLAPQEIIQRSTMKPPAQRLRVPAADDQRGTIIFEDRTYGPQCEVLARECGDFVVRRSDGIFAYQLAVVVDDASMGITEVVRGRDLLSSTGRQIYLQNVLEYPHPTYAHVPLLVAPDGRRLSKRDGDLDMGALRQRFGTSERLIGWLAFTAGLKENAAPISAAKLAKTITWDVVRAHKDNLVIDTAHIPV